MPGVSVTKRDEILGQGQVGDGVMLLLELERRQVVQAAVRSDGVEVKAPGFDDDLGLGA